jgi:transposase
MPKTSSAAAAGVANTSAGLRTGSSTGARRAPVHGKRRKASTILEFLAGRRGSLFVTFEEGTWAAWLYDLLKPHVSEVLVCNPRKIPLLKQGNKSDQIDARKLAERLRLHDLKPVYNGETGVRMLRELARSYLTVVKDLSRVMNRLIALFRSWAILCAGRDVYYTRHRSQWLEKIPEAGTRRRAEQLYQQLDLLQHLRQQARRELLAESRKHTITAKLRRIPALGPIRSVLAVALIQTPPRFRSKRQLWTYSGAGLETRDSGEYHYVRGPVRRRKKQATIRERLRESCMPEIGPYSLSGGRGLARQRASSDPTGIS